MTKRKTRECAAVSVVILSVLCLMLGSPAQLFASDGTESESRPKIGLVLQGGGARGFAHVGVLRVLEELRIPVDMVAGTSMGALVGAAYAAGVPLEKMEQVLSETDWEALFDEKPPREKVPYRMKPGRDREIYGDAKLGIKEGKIAAPPALIEGQKILPVLQGLYENASTPLSFDDLPIPYRAVAADIETGETVVLDHGNLALAARASMSVPGFFSPVEIDRRLLVDGGITNNLPVDVVLDMGADILIVVALPNELRKRNQLRDPISISGQILTFLLEQNSKASLRLLRPQDILIDVKLKGYGAMDFSRGRDIMVQGEVAARAITEKLQQLSISEEEYQYFTKHRLESSSPPEKIEFVRIEDTSDRLTKVIRRSLSFKAGDPFDRALIEQDLDELYRTGNFKNIVYKVREEDGKTGVIIRAEHKDWFKNYLRFGLSLEDNFEGDSSYSLGVNWRTNWINSYGAYLDIEGEVGRAPRLFAEFYQPFRPGSSFFVAPHAEIGQQKLRLRQGGENIAEYTRMRKIVGLELGYEIGEAGETLIAYEFGEGELERELGDPELPESTFDIGDLVGRLSLDTYDAPDFPKTGYSALLWGLLAREGLAADGDYEQAIGSLSRAFTLRRTTLLLGTEAGFSSSSVSAERLFAFGGWLDLSGFRAGDLLATDYFIARGVLYHQMLNLGTRLFSLGVFSGGSVEFANLISSVDGISDTRGIVSGSVFLGADTPLFPVYLSFGLSDQSEHSFYLLLGRISSSRR